MRSAILLIALVVGPAAAGASPEPLSKEWHGQNEYHPSYGSSSTSSSLTGPYDAHRGELTDGYALNLSFDPVGAVTGAARGSVAAALTDVIALRVDGQAIVHDTELGASSDHGWAAGVSVPCYLGGHVFNGVFIEPGVLVQRVDGRAAPAITDERAFEGVSLAAGYQWMFANGLNIAGSVGIARDIDFLATGNDDKTARETWLGLASLRVGWAFVRIRPKREHLVPQ